MDGRRVRRQCGATHAQERGDRQLFLRRVGDSQGRRGEPGGVPGCGGQFRRLRRAASPPAPVGAASAARSTARTAESTAGKECVSRSRYRRSADNVYKQKNKIIIS